MSLGPLMQQTGEEALPDGEDKSEGVRGAPTGPRRSRRPPTGEGPCWLLRTQPRLWDAPTARAHLASVSP